MTLRVGLLAFVLLACSPHRQDAAHSHSNPGPGLDGPAPLYENLGQWHHPISCTGQGAQAYFDQGLRLVYGFNHDEAIRAFTEASRRDPECAMAFWGIALAHGPNINLPLDDPRNAMAVAAVGEAERLATHASPAERAYVAALSRRYSDSATADRAGLDRAYADAMAGLAATYPDDADAAVLYAEALMDLHPWDLWTADGQPREGTPLILTTLERVISAHPDHPGAHHYYIHSIEASPHPERALESAASLPELMPGAGHLVHMPAHIYMRTGRYAQASAANANAAAVDEAYIGAQHPEGVYPMMYYPHNLHFLWASASMEGRSTEATRAARAVAGHVSPEMAREMPMVEYYMPTPFFALIRFGRWQEMLAEAAPPPDLDYDMAMWRYARGIAHAATGQLDAAADDRTELARLAEKVPADRIVGDNQPAGSLLQLALASLDGEIATRRHECQAAITKLEEAVRLQDGLPYMEPPPWYMPERQALGATLLECGKARAAARVFEEDLRRNPGNGWSLDGLARSLRKAGDVPGAARADARAHTAWAAADVAPTVGRP